MIARGADLTDDDDDDDRFVAYFGQFGFFDSNM